MKIYSVKDVKVGFNPPICRANDDLAIRDFKIVLSNPDSSNPIVKFPEDYELWCLGDINFDNGVITSDVRFVFSSIAGGSNE